MRHIVELRYALLPYLYSEFVKTALKGDLYFKPLAFEFADERARRIEDQLLVGEVPYDRARDRGERARPHGVPTRAHAHGALPRA